MYAVSSTLFSNFTPVLVQYLRATELDPRARERVAECLARAGPLVLARAGPTEQRGPMAKAPAIADFLRELGCASVLSFLVLLYSMGWWLDCPNLL